MGFIINPYQFGVSFTGLLDTYSGAAAAYSAARRLSSTYTGALIRVRRSSDNTEQDIGYDSNNVLDESALTAFVGANDGFVTTWYDQSGNALNVTQTTAANQPKIVSSGTVEKDNGKPKLTFDGSNDFLNGGDILKAGSGSLCSFVVSQSADNGTFYAKSEFQGSPSRYALFNSGVTYALAISGSSSDLSTTHTTQTNKKLFNQEFIANTSHKLYVNNSNVSSFGGTTTTIGNSTDLFLIGKYNDGAGGATGTNLQQNGFTQELIIYLSNQSANLSGINTNINTFYSIY